MNRGTILYGTVGTMLLLLTITAFAGETPPYLSPMTVAAAPDGSCLYIGAYTAHQVLVFDTASKTVTQAIDVSGAPTGLAVDPSGATVLVSLDGPDGRICAFGKDGAKLFCISAGHSPLSPQLSADGAFLYVCNRFDHSVSFINLTTHEEEACVPVAREPIALALTQDGQRLFVANHLPVGAGDGDYIAAQITVIDVPSKTVSGTINLPNGSTGLRGMCIAPDGAYVYVTHLLGRYQLPTTQLERGWMNTNALSILDANNSVYLNTVLLDDVSLGAANPWGISCSSDARYLCVAHAGTHEISVIDRIGLHVKLARLAAGEPVSSVSKKVGDVPNDLSFLVGLRKRIKLSGNGARGLAVIGNTAYAAEYFSDSLGIVDITAEPARPQRALLGPEPVITVARKGEMFFNDAALCFQHWQSCASCHPDARVDGLNWDLLNDGIGNPKNTRSMLLAHQTPPVMSLAVRADAETAVRSGIKFIQFAVRPEEDAVAIDEYLKSLTPVPSPELLEGQLSEAAQRGKQHFEATGCAACHPAPLYTSLKAYDIGTGTELDSNHSIDTPTLVEVWRTAPYLHDGRAATLRDIFKEHNPEDKHGHTSTLDDPSLDDLIAYLRSL